VRLLGGRVCRGYVCVIFLLVSGLVGPGAGYMDLTRCGAMRVMVLMLMRW
jgi:hypothetical protein